MLKIYSTGLHEDMVKDICQIPAYVHLLLLKQVVPKFRVGKSSSNLTFPSSSSYRTYHQNCINCKSTKRHLLKRHKKLNSAVLHKNY